jgi:hypothetical protein
MVQLTNILMMALLAASTSSALRLRMERRVGETTRALASPPGTSIGWVFFYVSLLACMPAWVLIQNAQSKKPDSI